MNRRTLFGRFLAVAAAFVVAPAVTVEAGVPDHQALAYQERMPRMIRGFALTFKTMADDCETRGCRLVQIFEVDRSAFVFHHDAEPWRPMHERHYEKHAEDGQRYVDRKPEALARVDAWRRGLHEQAVPTMPSREIWDSMIAMHERRSRF